jgi:hypothetical protein
MWVLLCGLVVAQSPLHDYCTPELASVYFHRVLGITTSATDYTPDGEYTQCTQSTCTNANPTSNLFCTSATHACAMCGDPDVDLIGSGYTVVVRSQCATAAPCPKDDIAFTAPIVFDRQHVLTIAGVGSTLVAKSCPLFTFVRLTSVTINDITIQCNSAANTDTAAAVSFSDSASTHLALANIIAMGYVLSTVLVMGGQDALPASATALSGAVGPISYTEQRYPDAVALTLTDFTGTLDCTKLTNFTRVIISPATGGALGMGYQVLDVINSAAQTNIYGVEIEADLASGQDPFGYTGSEINASGLYVLLGLLGFLTTLVVVSTTMFQNVSTLAKAAKADEHEE